MKHFAASVVAAALALTVLAVAAPAANAGPYLKDVNPIIFVHGFAGSASQFESQAMRFTSNGYRHQYIKALEYDSTFSLNTTADVFAKLDQLIAQAKEETGRDKVDVLGHSLGTTLMHGYLASPARAANVGHYVNIDGAQSASPPGGVPTLALWAGRGTPGRQIGGATNVTLPNQTHVQSATSAQAFVEMYKFFTGKEPDNDIAPDPNDHITLAGRATIFPQNIGAGGTTLEIWEVDGSTGEREGQHPLAIRAIGPDGSWGPIQALAGRHYEFALLRPGGATHHFYYEPFPRSDRFVRLLTSVPNQGLEALVDRSPNHSSLIVTRNKELWGDQGAENDVVEINGTNVINAATAPISHRVIGMFAFDAGSDGVSNVAAPLAPFFAQPFLSGVDLFIPTAPPGSVSVELTSRGVGPSRTVNFPNLPSTTDRVTVQLQDFE
jgi:pimeloyl-ACP methyl ester carboxylesterase